MNKGYGWEVVGDLVVRGQLKFLSLNSEENFWVFFSALGRNFSNLTKFLLEPEFGEVHSHLY